VFLNPDLTPEEAKRAFDSRVKHREKGRDSAKVDYLSNRRTDNNHGLIDSSNCPAIEITDMVMFPPLHDTNSSTSGTKISTRGPMGAPSIPLTQSVNRSFTSGTPARPQGRQPLQSVHHLPSMTSTCITTPHRIPPLNPTAPVFMSGGCSGDSCPQLLNPHAPGSASESPLPGCLGIVASGPTSIQNASG